MTASSSDQRMITGMFDDAHGAERAYRACLERGYELGEVNVLMTEETRNLLLAEGSQAGTELASHKAEGGELGGPHGGGVGMLVTITAAAGAAVLVPALGLVAGPIAVALIAGGAAAGAAGLIGLLGDWGIPDERIRQYRAGVRDGGILMMVEVRSDADARHIELQWRAFGGRDVHS